jgi:predicted nucleotidyltransferase
MTDTSKSYKELGTRYFKEVFDLIDETFKERGIPYYLIGANAISLELLKKGVKPSRGTRDIDFAVMISSRTQYEEFTRDFTKKGFVKVAAPWTFRHPEFDVVVDILPFGEIEQNYTENFDQRHTDLHVLGFKEVMSEATTIQLDETWVNIPTLPGFIILKLVAWSDRPEERGNDLGDILYIISEYFMPYWDHIIENHTDLLSELGENRDNDQRRVAAQVLGRESSIFLQKSEILKNRIINVLEKNIDDQFQSDIAINWAAKLDRSIKYTLSVLEAFLTGIREKL